MEILTAVLLILVAIAIVYEVARRIGVPYPTLLVLGGLGLAFIPGLPRIDARAGPGPAGLPAAAALQRRGRIPDPRPPREPGPARPPLDRPGAVHDGPRRGRGARPGPGSELAGRIHARGDRRADRRAGGHDGLPPARGAADHPDAHRRRGPVQRCDRAGRLSGGRGRRRRAASSSPNRWLGSSSPRSVGSPSASSSVGLAGEILRRLDDPPVEVVISVVIPFAAYLPADRLGLSGVLAAVTAGLVIGSRLGTILTPSSRVLWLTTWKMIGFVLNGFVFVLIGLELPHDPRGPREPTARGARSASRPSSVPSSSWRDSSGCSPRACCRDRHAGSSPGAILGLPHG